MTDRIEVKVWHRAGRAPQLTVMVDACETVIRLTPEDADELADQLKTLAQFVRHHTKRQRGHDSPIVHVAHPGTTCEFTLPNDHTIAIDGQGCVDINSVPATMPRCPQCWHEA